ncbi:MAG TPA: RagB/SusD family nutrient uptake outer membrane protein [Longimicrobiaceae bacterium]|nr:RagB/SusD family nutrient uptake outer membrane protein [Longimicrobiaceae bacterium]
MTTTIRSGKAAVRTAALALAALLGGGCGDLNIPEYNNPSIEDLTGNPTPAGIEAAAVGLQIGARSDMTGRTSYVSMLGVIGRESYTLDVSDPRYITELLVGPVTNSGAFGAGLWTTRYANIRLGNIILDALPNVAAYSDAQRAAVRGFTETIQALDFLLVINSRDVNGAPIEVGGAIEELAPLESKAEVFARIVQLLEAGRTDLVAAGGTPFPFPLSAGFAGFNTPATFLQFNRALRARVDVYMGNYAAALTALGQSFLSTAAPLSRGVYNTYGTGSDAPNELATLLVFAHPSIVTDAENKPDATPDNRLLAKVGPHPSGSRTLLGVTSDRQFLLYPAVTTPVPIIRNEELILLRSEARWFTGDRPGAMADLNFIRTTSGGLAAIAEPATDAAFVTELLKQRRYSLLFEGHRWIDVRRFGRLNTLPLDVPTHIRIAAFQIPEAECLARTLTSPCIAS